MERLSDTFFEPAEPFCFEQNIKRSRFIANVIPCENEETVREKIKDTCIEHRQANHNCWGYVIADPLTEHSSDAGEPSGTAGRPILGEISRSGLFNVLVIVTRYFGGVKLGVRGLIDAYGSTAAEALKQTKRTERIRTENLQVVFSHAAVGDVAHILSKASPEGEMKWNFTDPNFVTLNAAFRISRTEALALKLKELLDRKIVESYSFGEEQL